MTDEQVIRDKVKAMGGMFKTPTKELFEELFTADCDYITFMGQHLQGIDENLKTHQGLTGNWAFKGAELVSDVKQIKFFSDTVAVVIVTGAIKLRWQKKVNKSRMSINTNVFVKQNNDWKLASFQNTRITKPGFFQRLFS